MWSRLELHRKLSGDERGGGSRAAAMAEGAAVGRRWSGGGGGVSPPVSDAPKNWHFHMEYLSAAVEYNRCGIAKRRRMQMIAEGCDKKLACHMESSSAVYTGDSRLVPKLASSSASYASNGIRAEKLELTYGIFVGRRCK